MDLSVMITKTLSAERCRTRTDFVYVSPIFALIVQTFVQHGDNVNEISSMG